MGAARSVEAETIPDEEPGAPEPDAGRPYFFVAACPVGQAEEAIATAGRYGGFHCLDEQGGGSDSDTAQALAKWKGQAQGQFSILQKLSPEGRKVVVVVVGGAGEQAEQARFLDRLSRRRGYEQLDVKRCRDVQDLERWLKASGYRRVQVLGLACRPLFSTLFTGGEPSPPRSTALPAVAEESPQAGEAEASHDRTKPWNPVASLMETDLSMLGGPFAARRERALSDCEMAVEVSRDVRSDDPQALRAAKVKLGAAISDAVAAGVKERDLQRAREREEELQRLADARGGLSFLCCRGAARGAGEQAAEAAALPEPIPRLRPGTRCRYDSATKKALLSAVVEEFNESDCTYDLDVRPHAQPELISPDPRAAAAEAWPAGTLVDYTGGGGGRAVPAVIVSFAEGRLGAEGTYDLDVCQRVPVADIRPRR